MEMVEDGRFMKTINWSDPRFAPYNTNTQKFGEWNEKQHDAWLEADFVSTTTRCQFI